jgi:type IV pilus assembly protein PilY1
MKTTNSARSLRAPSRASSRASGLLLALCTLLAPCAQGAATDLSNQPLATTQINARPNLMFILDDSGSMGSDYMPDDVNNGKSYSSTYGYRSSQCNGLAYNPSVTYDPPVTPALPSGTDTKVSYPAMSAAGAFSDGYQPALASSPNQQSSSTTADLGFKADGSLTKTFTVSSTTGYAKGNIVYIKSDTSSDGSAAHWMSGSITALTSTTMTVAVTFSTADASVSYKAWTIGMASTNNLTGTSYYYYTYSGAQPRMSWSYNGSTGALETTTFTNECFATTGSTVFTKVLVSSLGAAAQTNYANWYSYYRKRILAIRAAAGSAFGTMSDDFRIGFTQISDTDAVVGSNGFLPVDNFTTSQKISFFNSLYSAPPSSSTPLRGALSKVGRYYANAARGQTGHLLSGQTTATPDPVQFSCQRNYAMLSTDGYWNTSNEDSSKGYGPYKVDGTTLVGQQDGLDGRPQFDGSVTTRVDVFELGSQHQDSATVTTTAITHPQGTKSVKTCTTKSTIFGTAYTCNTVTTPGYSVRTLVTSTTRRYTNKTKQTETVTYVNGKLTSDVFNPPLAAAQPETYVDDTPATVVSDTSVAWVATPGGTVTNAASSCTPGWFTSCSGWSTGPTTTFATDSYSNITPSPGTRMVGLSSPYKTAISSNTTSSGGASNSLSDVAEYYYVTPFRTSPSINCVLSPNDDACKGDLSPAQGSADSATYQHMTTYTLGLGVNGQFKYDANYITQTSGDYFNVKKGTNASGSPVNWPAPYDTSNINNDVPGKIDDLWHAAVNGRGQYFSASDNQSLSASLSKMLTDIGASAGYGGSAAASSLKPVTGTDTIIYLASYTTKAWKGNVLASKLEKDSSGNYAPITLVWNAADQLNARTYTDRKIYYTGTTTSGGKSVKALKAFTYANLQSDSLNGQFDNLCNHTPAPQQCAGLTTDNKTLANSGTNLVNFLRGERTNEITATAGGKPFRSRDSVLGDIINASPVYVGVPPFKYADTGYSAYVTAKTSRKKTLYAAANDGMLHAFSADSGDGGAERWAFIPTAVMPNMYRLADSAYKDNHLYFVDGSPVVGDVYDDVLGWRTILVGGLNKGGKAYYALDVTDPDSPAILWQFDTSNDADLGYTYGNPIITKVRDQTSTTEKWIWAVIFTSGYNNTENGGTGTGALYVLNANTGALIRKIKTTVPNAKDASKDDSVGDTTTPNGLARINAWIETETDNSVSRVYGGDLLGNLWRFDVNATYEPKNKSLRLAQMATQTVANGVTSVSGMQPITARPELSAINYGGTTYPIIMVGTGRYLGQTDLTDTGGQSIYAVKDPLTSTGWGAIKGSSDLVMQGLTDATSTTRTISKPIQKVDWSKKIGWGINLPTSKERVAIDMNLQYSTLAVISHIPEGTACSPAGKSWVYFLNVKDGATSAEDAVVGTQISSGLGTGTTWLDLGNGNSTVLVPDDKMGIHSLVPTIPPGDMSGTVKRTSWRELIN